MFEGALSHFSCIKNICRYLNVGCKLALGSRAGIMRGCNLTISSTTAAACSSVALATLQTQRCWQPASLLPFSKLCVLTMKAISWWLELYPQIFSQLLARATLKLYFLFLPSVWINRFKHSSFLLSSHIIICNYLLLWLLTLGFRSTLLLFPYSLFLSIKRCFIDIWSEQ